MFVVVGLGNPGISYENTRHNVGFKVIDKLSKELGVEVNKNKFQALYGETFYNGEKVLLVKPQTFMNLSGESVSLIVNYFGIDLSKLIVVYDDIDIDLGKIRVRSSGSAGTHNGMRSIVDEVGSTGFPRVRVGIGKPINKNVSLADYVLGRFYCEDEDVIEESFDLAKFAVLDILNFGVVSAMNKFNS